MIPHPSIWHILVIKPSWTSKLDETLYFLARRSSLILWFRARNGDYLFWYSVAPQFTKNFLLVHFSWKYPNLSLGQRVFSKSYTDSIKKKYPIGTCMSLNRSQRINNWYIGKNRFIGRKYIKAKIIDDS